MLLLTDNFISGPAVEIALLTKPQAHLDYLLSAVSLLTLLYLPCIVRKCIINVSVGNRVSKKKKPAAYVFRPEK
jgi:hypothetical protein